MNITDHSLNIIIACTGIVTIGVSLLIYNWQRSKKNLFYSIVSSVDLLTKDEKLAGKVKVLYEGNEVENIQVLTLKLYNPSKTAIVKGDFDGPIKIEFQMPTKILSVNLVSIKPRGLEVHIDDTIKNLILIKPLLLNGGDEMVLKFISDGSSNSFSIWARIKDIPKIKKIGDRKTLRNMVVFSISFVVLNIVLFLMILKVTPLTKEDLLSNILGAAAVLLSVMFLMVTLLYQRAKKMRGF